MKQLIEKIIFSIEISKNKSISYENLYKIIIEYNYTEEDPDKIIDSLLEKGIIFEQNGTYILKPKNYLIGTLEKSAKGNCYVRLENNDTIPIKKENLNGALYLDDIVFELNKDNTASVIKIIKRNSSLLFCQVVEKDNVKKIVPHNIKGIINLRISKEALKKLNHGDYILVKPSTTENKGAFDGEIIKKVELHGTIDENLAYIAYSHDCDVEYSKEAEDEAKKLPKEVSQEEINERKENDCRSNLFFTIDGVSTKDIDDAVSLRMKENGNFELKVAIADVAHYVKKGSALYNEACKRKFSLYLLNTVIAMFPKELSNGICSLFENVDRLTKIVTMEIDHKGNVISYKIANGVIRSRKQMTYDDVNSILENDVIPDGYEEYADNLRLMKKLNDILDSKRKEEGKIDINDNRPDVKIDEKGAAASIRQEELGISEKIVENFMLIANNCVAHFLLNIGLPCIFRNHEKPNKFKMIELAKILNSIGININEKELINNPRIINSLTKQIKETKESALSVVGRLFATSMNRAKYGTDNIGHWGTGFKVYTHFTSPIRRFIDLCVHYMLDLYFKITKTNEVTVTFNEKDFSKDKQLTNKCDYKEIKRDFEEISKDATIKEKLYDQAEHEARQIIIMEHMKKCIGQKYNGVISMIDARYIYITTDDGIDGIVTYEDIKGDHYTYNHFKNEAFGHNSHTKYKIGNRIEITVKDIDEFSKTIYFNLNKKIRENKVPQPNKKLVKKKNN